MTAIIINFRYLLGCYLLNVCLAMSHIYIAPLRPLLHLTGIRYYDIFIAWISSIFAELFPLVVASGNQLAICLPELPVLLNFILLLGLA